MHTVQQYRIENSTRFFLYFSVYLTDGVEDPVQVTVDSRVDAGHALGAAEPRAEGDHSYEVRSPEGKAGDLDVPHEAAAAVPDTGVLASLAPGTDLRAGQHSASLGVYLPADKERQPLEYFINSDGEILNGT